MRELCVTLYLWAAQMTDRVDRNEDVSVHVVCEGPTEFEHFIHTVPVLANVMSGWFS